MNTYRCWAFMSCCHDYEQPNGSFSDEQRLQPRSHKSGARTGQSPILRTGRENNYTVKKNRHDTRYSRFHLYMTKADVACHLVPNPLRAQALQCSPTRSQSDLRIHAVVVLAASSLAVRRVGAVVKRAVVKRAVTHRGWLPELH